MPTEAELRDMLDRGVPIHFPDAPRGNRQVIPAALLLEPVTQPARIVEKPIVVQNARIEGDLSFAFVDFHSDLQLLNCTLTGILDLSFSKFAQAAAFNNCVFEKDVTFRGCQAAGDLDWTGACFQTLDARHLKVCRDLLAAGAVFRGDAKMDQMAISGTAYFQGSHFHGVARFDLAKSDAGFDFGGEEYDPTAPRTIFHGQARFIGAAAKAYVSFICVEFRGPAWLDGMTVDGDAQFEGVQFRPNPPLKPPDFISFYGIHVSGQTVFDRARFEAYTRFDQARLDADTSFCSAQFLKRARFDNVVFGGPVRFTRREEKDPPVKFMDPAEFVGAAAPDVHFEECEFHGALSLRDANFKTARFQDVENPSHVCVFPRQPIRWWNLRDRHAYPRIDLRGFVYDRVLISPQGIDILRTIEPFDIQPYRQAEKVFRGMGDAVSADRVYLTQRWRTLRYHLLRPRHFLRALSELAYWVLANFGVRPYRLGIYALILITLATCQFTRLGSVAAKKDTACQTHKLNPSEALSLSIAYFLPVDVPAGDCWEATHNTAVQIGGIEVSFLAGATLLRLAGWVVVPLGVAALGGLMRRDGKN